MSFLKKKKNKVDKLFNFNEPSVFHSSLLTLFLVLTLGNTNLSDFLYSSPVFAP